GPRLGAGGFLLTNRDHASGNRNLTVEGGVWDGNNPGNPRGPDGPQDSYTGVALNFVNVRGLNLRGLTVRDPESFFIRLGETREFAIEDIVLEAPHVRPNQDGIHVGGGCEDGRIHRIAARGINCPNDDMVALNANDDVTRAINLGMREGPIRRVSVSDLTAEDAYTFVRLLSQDAPLEDVQIRGIRGGCRYHVLNLNRWRFPSGKGRMARVRIADVEVSKQASTYQEALVHITLNVQDLEIRDFRRPEDSHPETPTLEIANGSSARVELEGLEPEQLDALVAASENLPLAQGWRKAPGRGIKVTLQPDSRLRLPRGGFQRLRIVH
ncbi:MAG: hypothetical protein GX100_08210, partial [candidate division WS1 bacterium]|nr:hypothetical protein [candidate division WS1 bacterium]